MQVLLSFQKQISLWETWDFYIEFGLYLDDALDGIIIKVASSAIRYTGQQHIHTKSPDSFHYHEMWKSLWEGFKKLQEAEMHSNKVAHILMVTFSN